MAQFLFCVGDFTIDKVTRNLQEVFPNLLHVPRRSSAKRTIEVFYQDHVSDSYDAWEIVEIGEINYSRAETSVSTVRDMLYCLVSILYT